jgi:hypothetical protein
MDEGHGKNLFRSNSQRIEKSVVDLTTWMEGSLRKKLGMVTVNVRVWAVNTKQDGSCEDIEADR